MGSCWATQANLRHTSRYGSSDCCTSKKLGRSKIDGNTCWLSLSLSISRTRDMTFRRVLYTALTTLWHLPSHLRRWCNVTCAWPCENHSPKKIRSPDRIAQRCLPILPWVGHRHHLHQGLPSTKMLDTQTPLLMELRLPHLLYETMIPWLSRKIVCVCNHEQLWRVCGETHRVQPWRRACAICRMTALLRPATSACACKRPFTWMSMLLLMSVGTATLPIQKWTSAST